MTLFEEYQVDGKALPAPDADVEVGFSDLDDGDAGRDESGVMHRIVVRRRVGSWSFCYSSLTKETYRYIRQLFEGKDTFTFTYRDPEGQLQSVTAYCSNESVTYHNARLGLYKNLKFSIIQC